ncbi:MAG: hypothetical protein KDB01_00625 [Planctomycetaceae bacterium]|nr:hypothetical protein [Planctomycetaceae bacterium]
MRRSSIMLAVCVFAGCLVIWDGARAAAADSNLQFASAFTSGMVLQRQLPIVVTGSGPAAANVNVTLESQERSTQIDADGNWRVEFESLPAGGPYVMTASDGTRDVTLEDILIGDVWICSGQSNMQMRLEEVDGGEEAIAASLAQTPVRLLIMPKAGAETPQADLGTTWKHCTPESLRQLSAIAWFFASHLHQSPELADVPLGLVDTSFGGTSVEGWTPAGTLPNIPPDQISASLFGIPSAHLYNRMIAPLLACKVKGVVWYQGESNAGAPQVYARLLQNMIEQWRRTWQQPELPFLIVQLPAWEGRMKNLDFSWLREAQTEACRRTKQAWLTVSYDTTDGFDLHPREKAEIGRRLALLAQREVYGQNIVAHGPVFKEAVFHDDHVVITFDQELATRNGPEVRGVSLAAEDGEYRYATATIDGNTVTASARDLQNPVSVRFAWGAMPDANLVNSAGLPARPFRTDDQQPRSLAFEPLPRFYRVQTQMYALETGRGGSVCSLVVGGKQFLSHEPDGGTTIPSMFGPRNLAFTKVIGPRRLAISDSVAELEIACEEDSMTWTVTNSGDGPFEFHISLTPDVKIDAEGKSAQISRDGMKLHIDGIDRIDKRGSLVVTIPPHAATELHWTMHSR